MGGWESCKKDDNDGPQEREKTEDTTSKIFNFVYSETEDYVRNLPDEEHSTPLVISQADSLYFDQIVQEFLSEVIPSTLSKRGGGYEGQFEDDIADVLTSGSHISNTFNSKYTIEYHHWDAGDWGIAKWGNFETYVKVITVGNSKVALIILYKPQGFMQDGTAYIKLLSATYGKPLAKIPFKAKKTSNVGDKIKGQYIVIPYTLEGDKQYGNLINNKSFINLCPLIISNDGSRSYDNSIYIQSNDILHSNKVSVNGVDIFPNSTNGCEYVCAKYINVVAKLNKAVWASAKYWPEILKVADEGFDVYPNDGKVQVREGDILCFAPTDDKDYHVGVVTKIAPGQKATIVHTDNNNVFDWNTEVVINDKRDIELETITHITKRETELGTITHIIRKSSNYDTEIGAKYTEVHSVKPIVLYNLVHTQQSKSGPCGAYAYVMAAHAFAHAIDGSKTAYGHSDDGSCTRESLGNKALAVWKSINYSEELRDMGTYCKNNDKILKYTYCHYGDDRCAHSTDDRNEFKKFLFDELDNNRIIITNILGVYEGQQHDDCYYSDEPGDNPDLGTNPSYFTNKEGSIGHIIGIVSIKLVPNTEDGIVGYYDSAVKTREGDPRNNIRYVSLKNYLESNSIAGLDNYYDAYSVGLADDLKPIAFEINLSKTENICVNDKLELIILSDIVDDFKVMVDGKVIDQSNYNTLSKSKKAIILPTKEAKTYHGTVKTTYEGDDYEENFSYVVNMDDNGNNKELTISFEGDNEVNVEDELYVKIKTSTACTIEILDDFDDVIDKKTSTKEWDYKVDTKTCGYKELKIRATDDNSKAHKEATFEYEVSAIQVPNVSESKPTITVSSIAKNGKESSDDFQLTLKPNKTINPYYKSSYVGDGYFQFEKSSGNLNESGTTIAIMVVEGDSPSDLKNIKSNQIVGNYTDKDGTNRAKTYCFDRTEFTSSRSFYIIIVDSDSADGDGYYLGPLELAPVK